MNLQWGYNNVQINEKDKWKVASTTFELTVMFFGLTNSLAIF